MGEGLLDDHRAAGEVRGGVRGEDNPGQQLRQNLAGLAMVFGTAGLQNSMSETFGVDMVEVGSGTQGDSTLMVGKFIAPNLILKYNQSLEKSGTYFLKLLEASAPEVVPLNVAVRKQIEEDLRGARQRQRYEELMKLLNEKFYVKTFF